MENQNTFYVDNYKIESGIEKIPFDNGYDVPCYKIRGMDQTNKELYKKLIFIQLKTTNPGEGSEEIQTIDIQGFDFGSNILFKMLHKNEKDKINTEFKHIISENSNNFLTIDKKKNINGDIGDNTKLIKYINGDKTYYLLPLLLSKKCDDLFNEGIHKELEISYGFNLVINGKYIGYKENPDTTKIKIKINVKKKANDIKEEALNKISKKDYGIYLPIMELIKDGIKLNVLRGKSDILYDYINHDPPKIIGNINNNNEVFLIEEYKNYFE